jgi:carbon monoxide dehydrogenase subunit G
VRITDAQPPTQFRLHVEGAGKIGFMKGDGLLALTEAEAATDVQYDGEVHVGGTIASVGQRLMDGTAKMLIKRFFEKLGTEAKAGTAVGSA